MKKVLKLLQTIILQRVDTLSSSLSWWQGSHYVRRYEFNHMRAKQLPESDMFNCSTINELSERVVDTETRELVTRTR